MNPPNITLFMSVDACNLVLASLGERPYREVAGVIEMIKQQAEACLAQKPLAEEPPTE